MQHVLFKLTDCIQCK